MPAFVARNGQVTLPALGTAVAPPPAGDVMADVASSV
ncbi:hypothetical protein GA0115253_109132, partial [Streptomyces sp. Termitarium-T10T-6]